MTRQERAAQRREAILEAAAHTFTQKGYSGASIKDIAEAAEVADGTIYNYFTNKEALLLALFDRLVAADQVGDRLTAALDTDVDTFIAGYFGAHLARVRENYDLFRAVIPEILATPDLRDRYYQGFVAPLLRAAEDHLHKRSDVHPVDGEQMARVLYALFFGLLSLRILGDEAIQPGEETDARLLATIQQLFTQGLAAD